MFVDSLDPAQVDLQNESIKKQMALDAQAGSEVPRH